MGSRKIFSGVPARSHLIDVHTALRAGDDDRRAAGAIEEDGEVEFAGDGGRLRHKHLVDLLALRPGLVRDQRPCPSDQPRELPGLFRRAAQDMHAALEPHF